jgi:beta-glucanase (GH16 family)
MAAPANFTQTFDDEFNSLSLRNGSGGTWSPAFSYSPNGSTDGSLSSYQVNPLYGPTSASDANVYSISNGVLSMAIKPTPADISSTVSKPFIAGQLLTDKSFSQTYGYFEMNAKLSNAAGVVNGFWLLPADGSWPPELDVAEVVGSNPKTLVETSHSSGGTTPHWTDVPDTSQAFHTYAVDWEPDKLTWYFDGKQVAQQDTPADMNKPMYMLLSTVVGTSSTWAGNPTPGETGQMQVDYVRAYSHNPNAAAAPAASSPTASTPAASTPSTSTPSTSTPSTSTPGAGTSTLNLSLSEDAWKGDARFSVAIDGTTVGAPQTVTALHSSGATQKFAFDQALTPGTHDVAVSFLNDAYGGSTGMDRNLYIDGASVGSTAVAGAAATLFSASTQHISVNVAAPV